MKIENDKDDNLIVDLGRVKVAYIFSERSIRVINAKTGEVLRKDPVNDPEDFTIKDFQDSVNHYKQMMGI